MFLLGYGKNNKTYDIYEKSNWFIYSLCYLQNNQNITVNNTIYEKLLSRLTSEDVCVEQIDEGVLFASQEPKSKLHTVMLVPQQNIDAVFKDVKYVLLFAWLFFSGVAVLLINYFSADFVGAITKINKTMKAFNGRNESQKLILKTATELDEIAYSYNQMAQRINQLMQEVTLREKALRDSELNSLMYQINPHFLYNTLDNIYMMARLDHDEQMKRMIEALSKFLRIGLSKGKQEITIGEELQHVKSYLDIMQMRGSTPFVYQITCEEKLKNKTVLKLILQPIVENCIKYGFQDCMMHDQAKIDVVVSEESKWITLSVRNNGKIIKEDVLKYLNHLQALSYDETIEDNTAEKGGYGVRNVMNRLWLKYGKQFTMQYQSNKEEGTTCVIKIPK